MLAEPSDAENIIDVHVKTWIETYPNVEYGLTKEMIAEYYNDRTHRIDRLQKELETKEENIWVAKVDGRIVGYCTVRKTKNYGVIEALYILPEYQKSGIGGKLLKLATENLNGMDITLTVASTNMNAISFYEHFGFKIFEEIQESDLPAIQGVKLPLIRMILKKV